MKRIALVILMIAVVCPVFAKKAKQKKKKYAENEITSVMIYRTTCFGKCPEYKLEISAEGMATYTGMRFCNDTGIFTKKIDKQRATEIIGEFVTYKADTCRDLYENRIPDLPQLLITINYPNRKKVIHNSQDGPDFLRYIANEIDALAKMTDRKGWKKIGMPKF